MSVAAPRSAAAPRPAAGPWLAFAVSCAIWGSTFLVVRFSNDTTPPVWGAGVRLGLAALLLTAIAFARRVPWPRGEQLTAALLFGIVDFGVSLPLLYWGEQTVPSGIAAVIFATIPLSTSLFARAFGLEPLRRRVVLASLAGLGGVGLMFSSNLEGHYEPARLVAVVLAGTHREPRGRALEARARRPPAGDERLGAGRGRTAVRGREPS
jgi:drug/metabolite transporter (DMT)-like permease